MTTNNDLFIFDSNDNIVINPKALLIPEFAKIHNDDRSQGKRKSLKELRYVYFMADYKSEYNSYGLQKESQLGWEIFNNKFYKPDPDVQAAIEKYKECQKTHSMQYLIAVRTRADNLIQFLTEVQIRYKKADGTFENPFVDIMKITKTLNELEEVMEKLEKWERKVFEEEEDMQIRGGGKLNVFEDPQSAEWIFKKK